MEGHHYKPAADAMGISTNTISFHLEHIYEKLPGPFQDQGHHEGAAPAPGL